MKKTILIAAVMFFALSVSAFAQSSFTIASEKPIVACCGLAEPVGAIQFTAVPVNPTALTATGTLTINYTQPIANFGLTNGTGGIYNVQVVTTGGTPATLENVFNTGTTGTVVVTIPSGQPTGYSVTVRNVRVNVSTSCNTPSAVTASAASVGNFLTVSETDQIQVLSGIQPALLTPTVTAVAVDASNGTATPATAVINVQEGFLNAFGLTAATDTTQSSGKIIRLTLTGTLPAGVTLTFPGTDTSGLFTRSNATGTLANSPLTVTNVSGAISPSAVYYVLTTDSNATQQETFSVNVGVSAVGPYPLAPGAVSVSAHIGPISNSATVFPRYTEGTCETAATQFLTVSGALTTTLLVPYAVDLGNTEGAYQTGIVVSNTTKDPGTTAMGFLQAIRQTGKITVYFYPSNGSTVATWVSTGFPNFGGLDANGNLPPGGQFTAMVNQLFPSTVTSFSGYLFIITDFTNAHGEFFISNFDNFTHGALMLVVNNPNVSTLVGRTVSEGLNQ